MFLPPLFLGTSKNFTVVSRLKNAFGKLAFAKKKKNVEKG